MRDSVLPHFQNVSETSDTVMTWTSQILEPTRPVSCTTDPTKIEFKGAHTKALPLLLLREPLSIGCGNNAAYLLL